MSSPTSVSRLDLCFPARTRRCYSGRRVASRRSEEEGYARPYEAVLFRAGCTTARAITLDVVAYRSIAEHVRSFFPVESSGEASAMIGILDLARLDARIWCQC